MADIIPTSVHLPIEVWIANAALVTEPFLIEDGQVVRPRIQNLQDIKEQGTALGEFLDNQTQMFSEPKTVVDIPNLTAVGPKLRDVKQLSGPEEVNLPINAFTYALYAIMTGLDPKTAIVNDADVRYALAGYTDNDGPTPNPVFDRVASMIDRQETIDMTHFCLLAHVQPGDPLLGDKYFLCPKLVVNMEQVQQMMQSGYYQQTVAMRSVVLSDSELERWQNIVPSIRKTIGLYTMSIDTPES